MVRKNREVPRTYVHGDFDAASLAASRAGHRISVCIPARDEEATVGAVVSCIVTTLTARGGGVDLVDEVLVVDDRSTDATVAVARDAGARVVSAGASGGGKGQAMRVALGEATGDLIVFLDADVENFGPHFVVGLLGPLLCEEPGVEPAVLVKGCYERPLGDRPSGGGRVTELVAKPAIDLLFPALSGIRQPLAGETAAPRAVLEKVELFSGYGVELALLVDIADRFGTEAIAQVDLGVRIHRNRPLHELRAQATEVLRAALVRADELRAAGGSHLGPR